MSVPPRLHFIVARKAPVAVVFRRGPSKQVAVLKWDLKSDKVTLGQWLKGRIYPMRSDISPDGRHMIYFAMDGRWEGKLGGSWTAVSEVPYLTALHLYGWGHCWNGGGLFLDDRSYWLNAGGWTAGPEAQISGKLRRTDKLPEGVQVAMGEDPGIYLPRLLRDGWKMVAQRAERGVQLRILEKPVRKGWRLEKTFHAGIYAGPNREAYFDTHRLIGPEGAMDLPGVECADLAASTLLFAKDGALWRQQVHASGPDEARRVADLTDMVFEPREAPYAGARAG